MNALMVVGLVNGGALHANGDDISTGTAHDWYGCPFRRPGVLRTRRGWNNDRRRGVRDQMRGDRLKRTKTSLITPRVWRRQLGRWERLGALQVRTPT